MSNLKPDLNEVEKIFNDLIFNKLKLQQSVPLQHIQDTPRRIAKMLVEELFKACYSDPPEVTVFNNDYEDHQIICVDNLEIRSMCSHHFMPFYGKMKICYIPDKKIVGLSKFARVAQYFQARPQIQEELTKQIVTYLSEKINPIAIGAYVRCQHTCMVHRGAKTDGWMETKYIVAKNEESKQEIIREITMCNS